MVKYVKTEQGYVDASVFAPAQFKPEGKSYLTFSSPKNFTLKVDDKTKNWDGTLEYFDYDRTWTTWDGTTILSAVADDGEYFLYLRGTENTFITRSGSSDKFVLTGSDISCIGNIENLLDYASVESGEHPTMANYCYYYMFYGCTALTQAPVLPATTLANYCYSNMFRGCTALTQAPALPATTLSNGCYSYMFSDCTSLTQAPALPATTLSNSCYQDMFYGCTALTQAPALPATTMADYCYQDMFYGCTALTQAPVLPATTLANYCYRSMFRGCTALTQAPALPATTLSNNCYYYMFYGCTSLKLSSAKTGKYTQAYRIPTTGTGTTATGSLTNMFTSTGGTFTGTPAINTTYYLSTDNMIVRDTEVATLNGYVGSMIDNSVSNPLNITGATVGQIAKITAVDESGKPTSWEAADIYEKPDTGIPKSDLEQSVQTSLDKADTAISYNSQTLTEEQQEQARTNIGAGQPVFVVNVTSTVDDNYTADKTAAEIEAAYQAGRTIVCRWVVPFIISGMPVELPLKSREKERVFIFAVDQLVKKQIFTITVEIRDSGVKPSIVSANIYEKPASGIPKSDLAEDVQTSLAKADTAISLGLTAATPGQIIKVKTVQDGKPTEWEAVDMPSGDKWEKIKEITIAEGAEESNALTINADENGNTFRLKKARLCARFPAYTGTSTIPNFSFAMINGKTTGRIAPLLYTSVWPKISTELITGTIYYVDVSGAQQIEQAQTSVNSSWENEKYNDYRKYGSINDESKTMYGDTLWAKPITSIGGAGMLIYPGCHFVLYGVRE